MRKKLNLKILLDINLKFRYNKIMNNFRKKGFTMIELLVAIASFIIILSITLGGFTRALRTQRQVIGLMNANNNSSLILEQIAREIRTSYFFCKNTPCSLDQLNFTNAEGKIVSYRLNNNSIERGIYNNTTYDYKQITADDVVVNYLNFIIKGQNANDRQQPFITILMGISSKEGSIKGISVHLQTSISPRPLDS